MAKDTRTRNYATVVYPESAPDDWLIKLGETCISSFVSPLHDSDINPTGERKKPHYHVMIMFDNVKSIDQAKEVFELIGGVGVEKIKTLRGYARYLCHLDNPEKEQYDVNKVLCFGGADYLEVVTLSSDKLEVCRQIEMYCEMFQLKSYSQLRRILRTYNYEWYKYVTEHSISILTFLKSYDDELAHPEKYMIPQDAINFFEKK